MRGDIRGYSIMDSDKDSQLQWIRITIESDCEFRYEFRSTV